jgi:4-methylaminobutanoate oxidase (formaldehyde-forming)
MEQARAVIVGAGIAGASIAYHLAERGWREAVVLEQGEPVSGTTSHAPGLVGQLRSSASLTRMLMYSVSLYRQLTVAGIPGFHGEGSLRLASSKERWLQLQQQAQFAKGLGLEAHLLSGAEAIRHFPLMSLGGIEGALYLPGDGSAAASVLAQALLREAQAQGVTVHSRRRVQAIDVVNGSVRGVATEAGRIETDTVVAAAGIWSPLLARMAGVALPLVPLQHQYVVTGSLPGLAGRSAANLRDPDKLIYIRQRDQGLVIGGYERDPQPFDEEAIPDRAEPTVQPFAAGRFEPLYRAALQRVPGLAGAALIRRVNGLEAFTPDGEFLLGPAPEVKGFWSACGFCAHGVSSAGGVGRALAEWIVHGDPGADLSAMALERFRGKGFEKPALRAGACAVYSTYYDLARPGG